MTKGEVRHSCLPPDRRAEEAGLPRCITKAHTRLGKSNDKDVVGMAYHCFFDSVPNILLAVKPFI